MPFVAFYHTHKLVVTLFILIYLIKAILLLFGNKATLEKFNKRIRIPEMIISTLFLVTGVFMLTRIADFNLFFGIKLSLVALSIVVGIVAYKRYNKLLGIFTVLLLIMAYGLAEMYKAQFGKKHEIAEVIVDPTSSNYSLNAHGEALYNAQCIVCHGEDGKANLSGAKDLTISEKTEDEMLLIIKNGKNTMPAMGNIYTDQELKALTNYVKTLR